MSVGAHFSVNITMGSHGVKGHKYKFTWQTQAVMLSCLSFIPVLSSISWGNVEADGSLCFRAVECAGDDHQHALCKSVCAHLERKVHAKGLNCIGTVHRGDRSVFACWCVVKLEKNLYQVRTGAKQMITTRCELTASITRGQRSAVYTWYSGHAPFLVNGGSYCWKCHQVASGLISSDGSPKNSLFTHNRVFPKSI